MRETKQSFYDVIMGYDEGIYIIHIYIYIYIISSSSSSSIITIIINY